MSIFELPIAIQQNTIQQRIDYLTNVIKGNIKLKPGDVTFLSHPCRLKDVEGSYEHIGGGQLSTVYTCKPVCISGTDDCCTEFVVKEIEYNSDPDFIDNDNPFRGENVEVNISKLMSDLVIIGSTPHIPLYLGDFTCKIKDKTYRHLMLEKYDTTIVSKNILYSTNNIPITRWDSFYRNIIFQVVYTLRIINKRYPTFIHNDLHVKNVFINKSKNEGGYYKYIVDDMTYILPAMERIAIADFGLSSIMDQGLDNAVVEFMTRTNAEPIGVQTDKNPTKDIYKFLFDLRRFLYEYKNAIPETMAFMARYLPQVRVDKYFNMLDNLTFYTLKDVLQDPYFSSYTTNDISSGDPLKENIIEVFSDDRIEDMTLKNLTPAVHSILKFSCEPYDKLDLLYFEYKDTQFNDQNRIKCRTSRNHPNIIVDYNTIRESLEIAVISRYQNHAMLPQILRAFHFMFEKFVNLMYATYVSMYPIILDKAVFLVTKKRDRTIYYNYKIGDKIHQSRDPGRTDKIIQFNLFVEHYGLDDVILDNFGDSIDVPTTMVPTLPIVEKTIEKTTEKVAERPEKARLKEQLSQLSRDETVGQTIRDEATRLLSQLQ